MPVSRPHCWLPGPIGEAALAADLQRLVLRFVDAALAHARDPALIKELSGRLGHRQVAELAATVGHYDAIATFVLVLDVDFGS